MAFWNDVMQWLDENPGIHKYGDVAEGLGRVPGDNGRAVGAAMQAIHRRGHHEYCVRVVDAHGEHGCSNTRRRGGD